MQQENFNEEIDRLNYSNELLNKELLALNDIYEKFITSIQQFSEYEFEFDENQIDLLFSESKIKKENLLKIKKVK